MPVSPTHSLTKQALTTPVVDYEPPPVGGPTPASEPCSTSASEPCSTPASAALHRRRPQPGTPPACGGLRPTPPPTIRELPPPRSAAVFADAALRRVLEVVDRRRPIVQLRPMLSFNLLDSVAAMTRNRNGRAQAAVLRRVRLRTAAVETGRATAAEVFASYTRGPRVRAIAARIERVDGTDRWQLVALQIG